MFTHGTCCFPLCAFLLAVSPVKGAWRKLHSSTCDFSRRPCPIINDNGAGVGRAVKGVPDIPPTDSHDKSERSMAGGQR